MGEQNAPLCQIIFFALQAGVLSPKTPPIGTRLWLKDKFDRTFIKLIYCFKCYSCKIDTEDLFIRVDFKCIIIYEDHYNCL